MCVKWVKVIGWDSRTRLRVATGRFVIVYLQKICFYYLLQFSSSYTAILHMKYGKEFRNMEFSRKRFEKFTERARKVLDLALEEAQHEQSEMIGTEHILLALVNEGGGVAAKVLEQIGTTNETLRNTIRSLRD